ncbi:MAG: histidine kinase [Cyclobacteriaceae bacterium]|nr:histidine kinase [Cyclobacteriaceae bacterium]
MTKESKAKEYLLVIVVSVVGSVALTYLTCDSCHDDPMRFFYYASLYTALWAGLWIGNSYMNDFLSERISWIETPIKRLVVGIIATILFTVIVAIIILKGFEFAMGFRFNSYLEIIQVTLIITFFISLFFHSRGFLMEWKRSVVEAERYQKESIKANYESLKNQVNPHFLFNSLNALTSLVYEDQDKAAKFIKQLSDVYRYVLDTRGREVVAIEEELQFLNSYLFLQEIRFGGKLIIMNDLKELKGNVPPLALQMLVENAIKHNIVSEAQPLTIQLYKEQNNMVVVNNLQLKKDLSEGLSGVGLDNIKKRYQFLSNGMIEVVKTENSFCVKLPILSEVK